MISRESDWRWPTVGQQAILVMLSFGVIGISASVSLLDDTENRSKPGASEVRIVLAEGNDRYPSQSANDWVTYADYVVVATAVSEHEIPPDRSEIERGEGLIGREIAMRVDRVVWASPTAPVPAPEAWSRTAMGWAFAGSVKDRTKLGKLDSPRIEAGHTYVIALDWAPDPCRPETGEWLGLGEGSTVPFDGGVLGVGEYEGRVQTLQQAFARRNGSALPALEEQLAGRGVGQLSAELAEAVRVPVARRYKTTELVCED